MTFPTGRAQLFNGVHHSTSQSNTTLLSGLDDLLSQSSLHLASGDVVELQGSPSTGKTSLLLLLALIATLPPSFALACQAGQTLHVDVGGKSQGVVWADCDAKFDVVRLAQLMRAHLGRVVNEAVAAATEHGTGPPPVPVPVPRELDQQLGQIVSDSLNRVVVLRPTSTLQLATTLEALPVVWLAERRPVLLYLLIDGISSFWWQDQRDLEGRPSRPLPGGPHSLPSATPPLRLFLSAVAHVRATLAPTTFLTQWILQPSNITHQASSALPQRLGFGFVQHHMPPPYPQITSPPHVSPPGDLLRAPTLPNTGNPTFGLKLHITCYRMPKQGIKCGTGLKEALGKQREGREAGPRGDRFVGLVRAAGGRELGAWEYEVEKVVST